eukprot:TRINITY_DN814_c1_g1_i1.p1 TRINITY_DN814_c1_g1~~TRINITY_DN814_c1_g1_i1.p1  ORF type:complete len:599 (-),score=63.06 TRINITY_DN814_c1_g1_i1:274-1881(-)
MTSLGAGSYMAATNQTSPLVPRGTFKKQQPQTRQHLTATVPLPLSTHPVALHNTSRKRAFTTSATTTTTTATQTLQPNSLASSSSSSSTASASIGSQTEQPFRKRICVARDLELRAVPLVSLANKDEFLTSGIIDKKPIVTENLHPYLQYQRHQQQFYQPLIQHQVHTHNVYHPQQEAIMRQLYAKKIKELSQLQEDILDDKRGHLIVQLGQNLTPRYKILDFLGEGTFAKVVECWDRVTKTRVAIKIVRSLQKYKDAALMELNTLAAISDRDPQRLQPCVQYQEWFEHGGHVCIVFEKLGMSLYEYLRENQFKPIPAVKIQTLAIQIIQGVSFLHGELDLIHTDLKPENILFVVPGLKDKVPKPRRSSNEIVLIDFGSATFEHQYHTSIVSTRQYRSPEVILGTGWTYPCDMWSVGCILMELYLGEALFQTHDNLEHLAMMERVLGAMPKELIRKASTEAQQYFLPNGVVKWPTPLTDTASVRKVKKMTHLENIINKAHSNFYDLVSRMLVYEPSKRITAREAIHHRFLTEGFN